MRPRTSQPSNPDHPNPDLRPYLSIPYWTAPITTDGRWDDGAERPLPTVVTSYLCESIRTGPYAPGRPLDVVVDVCNSGGGSATAVVTVAVYWAVPTVGFANPTFFGAATVAVPAGRRTPSIVPTRTITAVIPSTAPDHICLLAVVSHDQDRPGNACDPVNDRHWAQRNLVAARTTPENPTRIPFMAANPLPAAGLFEVRIGRADPPRAVKAARVFNATPIDTALRMQLLDQNGTPVSTDPNQPRALVQLAPRAKRPLQLQLQPAARIPSGRCVVLEATLSKQGVLVGSLGLAVLAR